MEYFIYKNVKISFDVSIVWLEGVFIPPPLLNDQLGSRFEEKILPGSLHSPLKVLTFFSSGTVWGNVLSR